MKPRRLSLEAQIRRMRAKWPEFRPGVIGSTSISWMGPLRGFQMDYTVLVRWSVGQTPKAIVVSPQLRPRVGTAFIDIPHLILDVENPEDSPLCLFDPEAGEWNDTLSVADTILPGHRNGSTTTSSGTWMACGEDRTHRGRSRSVTP